MLLLQRMQALLTRLYDAPVEHAVADFLVCDRNRLLQFVGPHAQQVSDEHVFMVEEEQGVRIGLFIEQQVLERLARRDPLNALD